jgi:putative inorganic carbon (HCO3(-)) transporter
VGIKDPTRRWLLVEGVTLLAASPFLLVPELSPIAASAALAALVIVWLLALRENPLPPTPFNVVFLPWGAVLIVGILASADPAETLPKATGLILGLAVWRYLVVAIRSRRHILAAVALLLLICLGFSLMGIMGLQEIPKIPLLGEANPFSGGLPGLEGFAVHPNQLAGLICLFLPLLVSLLAVLPAGLSSWWRFVLVAAIIVTILILMLTQSRGGWVSAALGLFILLLLWAWALPPSRERRAVRLVAGGVTLLALLALIWIGPTLWEFWLNPPQETALGTFSTLNYRKDLWPWALAAIEDFPFSGVGLGAFRLVAFRLYPLTIDIGDIGHAHSMFLQTALDLGLPGLVVYLAILLVAAATGWRVARRDEGFRSISLGLLAGLAAFHIFGLADAVALGAKPAIVFWFALGLLAAMSKRDLAAPETAASHSSRAMPQRKR